MKKKKKEITNLSTLNYSLMVNNNNLLLLLLFNLVSTFFLNLSPSLFSLLRYPSSPLLPLYSFLHTLSPPPLCSSFLSGSFSTFSFLVHLLFFSSLLKQISRRQRKRRRGQKRRGGETRAVIFHICPPPVLREFSHYFYPMFFSVADTLKKKKKTSFGCHFRSLQP